MLQNKFEAREHINLVIMNDSSAQHFKNLKRYSCGKKEDFIKKMQKNQTNVKENQQQIACKINQNHLERKKKIQNINK